MRTCLQHYGWVLLICLLIPAVRADEAVLPNGRRLQGELLLEREGRLRFQPAVGPSPLPLDQIHHVLFTSTKLPPLLAGVLYRVTLRDGQSLTGEFLSLDEQNLYFRPAWGKRLAVPLHAVASLTHATGYVPLFKGDFETDLGAWKLTGPPTVANKQQGSGRCSLRFDTPGQTAEYCLAAALPAGQVGINFLADEASGTQWLLETDFEGAARRLMRVRIAGDADYYAAEVSGAVTGKKRLPRSPGWHRLRVDFSSKTLLVSVDEDVLWFSREPGVGGPLHKVRLACVPHVSEKVVRGKVFFEEFCLARTVPNLTRPEGDASQDEIWLLSGDQLFGKVSRVNSRIIDLRSAFGSRTFAWGEVRGLYLRQQSALVRKSEEGPVRVWLRSGGGLEPDQLEGTVHLLDQKRLVLKHALLGELEIERRRLHRLTQLRRAANRR
jgi:hypothetical protein